MKNLLLFSLLAALFLSPVDSVAQNGGNIWNTLAKITFKKEYDEMLGFKVDVPVFSDQV